MEKNEVWFITGASVGIGKELAKCALNSGYCVVATARNTDLLKDIVTINPEKAIALHLDVTKKEEIKKAVGDAIAKFGKIDVLCNNAGGNYILKSLEELGETYFRDIYEINVFSVINVTNEVLPHMRKAHKGHIINISSIGGYRALACSGAYGSAKHAVSGLSEAYQKELAPLNIRVSVIAPSGFRTDFGKVRAGTPSTTATPGVIDIPDYAEIDAARAKMQAENTPQPGDPVLAAAAIVHVHEDNNAPFRVFLGRGAVEIAKQQGQAIIADAIKYEKEGIACDSK